MNNPRISVIIPCYNSEKFIKETMDSVLSQTYRDFEVIVIDDGSKDKTREIIQSFDDERIKYYYKKNGGMADARNEGIKLAKGEHIAFLDHDDIWFSDKLELQLSEIEKSECIGIVYSGYIEINDKHIILRESRPLRKGMILKNLLIEGNIVGTPSCVIVRKRVLDKVGVFNPSLSISADWDLWIRIAKFYQVSFVDKVLLKYRVHENSAHKNLILYEKDSLAVLCSYFKDAAGGGSFRKFKRASFANIYISTAGSCFKNRRYFYFLKTFFILVFCYPDLMFKYLLRDK